MVQLVQLKHVAVDITIHIVLVDCLLVLLTENTMVMIDPCSIIIFR